MPDHAMSAATDGNQPGSNASGVHDSDGDEAVSATDNGTVEVVDASNGVGVAAAAVDTAAKALRRGRPAEQVCHQF